MSFAESLRNIRRQRGLTQDDLAEMLNVSRQAVSKWESENGYPEFEKIIELSDKLGVSLDELIKGNEKPAEPEQTFPVSSGKIRIKGYDNDWRLCESVRASEMAFAEKGFPKYMLMAVLGRGLLGSVRTEILAYYDTEEARNREADEIAKAMDAGQPSYALKYDTKVELKGFFAQPTVKK